MLGETGSATEATGPPIPSPLECLSPLTEEIGPRGPTTRQEAAAAEHVAQTLGRMGLRCVRLEQFTSPRSVWLPFALAASLAVLAAALSPWRPPLGGLLAAGVTAFALGCALGELNFHPTPLRKVLPQGRSQNVVAVAPPHLQPRQTVVLVAHLDTQRTPILFRTPVAVVAFVALVGLGVMGGVANIVLYPLGAFTGWPWVPPTTLGFSAVLALVALFAFHAEATPFTVGANDNASAVGVTLHLAHLLAEHPLMHTEVWTLFTGCEEAGCHGMDHFLQQHGEALREAHFINFEGVGIGQIHYAVREGMTASYHSDPDLVALAAQVVGRHPDWRVKPKTLAAGFTETGLLTGRGFGAITLVGLSESGFLPNWHHPDDTLRHLQPQTLDQAAQLAWEMLQEMDRAAKPA
ncbi:MAG: Zn-dependent exopeptidase M28 [Chloroflexi bacterium]|nr:Zn-dependent exopeptidase M28 [Chloroflexota bacterium]